MAVAMRSLARGASWPPRSCRQHGGDADSIGAGLTTRSARAGVDPRSGSGLVRKRPRRVRSRIRAGEIVAAAIDLQGVVAAQVETVRGERLLDLFDRLLAEVRNRSELALGFRDEVADRLDPDPLQAVVRADAELELLDREVLHPVRERRLLRRRLCGGGLAEALDLLDVREDRELADQDVGCLADRLAGIDRAVRGDVERQFVIVRALTDACGLDVVRDAPHGREERVDRDDADRMLGPAVELGRDV